MESANSANVKYKGHLKANKKVKSIKRTGNIIHATATVLTFIIGNLFGDKVPGILSYIVRYDDTYYSIIFEV